MVAPRLSFCDSGRWRRALDPRRGADAGEERRSGADPGSRDSAAADGEPPGDPHPLRSLRRTYPHQTGRSSSGEIRTGP